MTRYLPADLPPPFTSDGWLTTRDRGDLDARGRLTIFGRDDDVIVTGGEKVDPLAIERAVEGCPGVRRAFVFGVPDATWGALVAVAVIGDREDADLPRRLAEHCARTLPPAGRPRRLALVDDLPETADGKPARREAALMWSSRLVPLFGGHPGV